MKEINGYTFDSTTPATLVTPVSSTTSSLAENGLPVASKGGQGIHNMAQPQILPPAPAQPDLPSLPGSSPPHHPIAEFLYQLTKMLTDDNSEIIEWTDGKIKVHHPERLEGDILHKYFRHSKFASFQRQLNYFGFRKIAGKGKMSPCSYVNDAATSDIRSILLIKRKTNGSAARKAAMAQRAAAATGLQGHMGLNISGIPMSADFFKQALTASMGNAAQQNLGMIHSGMMFATPDQQQAVLQQQAVFQQQAVLQQQAYQTITQQKASGESLFLPNDSALAAFAQSQRQFSAHDMMNMKSAGSLEHLQQLTAARNSALSLAGFGFGSASTLASFGAPAPMAPSAAPVTPSSAPGAPVAPAPAEGAMPATTAMNATAALNAATASNQSSNMFESSSALTALVANYPGAAPASSTQSTTGLGTFSGQGRISSTNLLRGLPSSGAMFPDSLSSISLTGLLPGNGMSSNRLNSMLSLSSFLSRDPSMAELLPGSSNANLANFAAGAPLGNTTLVPLTGAPSPYGHFGGASAALSSLAGGAGAWFGAFPAGFPGVPAPAPQSTNLAPAPPPAAPATAGAPVGFEPTPIQDMGSRQR